MASLNIEDQELLKRDTSLPGLRYLLDPELLIEELNTHSRGEPLESLQLDYIRYKPGMSCIGRYRFGTRGSERLAYTKIFGPNTRGKLEKISIRTDQVNPVGAGPSILMDKALLFARFPTDIRLRSIARLEDPANAERLIGRMFKNDDAWLGSRYRVLNYKPERRLVCRIERPDGQCATAKFYTASEFSHTLHLRRRETFARDLPLPRRIGGSRKHCVHAFSWLPGLTLRELTLDRESDTSIYHGAGGLLARLHKSKVSGLEAPRVSHLPAGLSSLADQLAFILPDVAETAANLAQRLCRIPGSSKSGQTCLIHADFYDKQLLSGPDGLSIIDLDQASLGSPAQDLGCFIAHLERLAIKDERLDGQRVQTLSESILDGYLAAGGQYDEADLAVWTALALFQLSHHPFRDRSENWPDQTREILQKSQQILAAAGQNQETHS